MTIIDTDKIQQLLDSKISGYEIEKRSGVSRANISLYRTKAAKVLNMNLDKAIKLQKFWEEYTMTKKYFNGKSETVVLEGSVANRRQQIYGAIHEFTANEDLSEEVNSYLYNTVSNLRSETLNDSERLYLSFNDIAAGASEGDEIPTGGELDNGFEEVVRYFEEDLENGKTLYLLLTYDI